MYFVQPLVCIKKLSVLTIEVLVVTLFKLCNFVGNVKEKDGRYFILSKDIPSLGT